MLHLASDRWGIIIQLEAVEVVQFAKMPIAFILLSLHLRVVLAQHGFLIGQPTTPACVRLYKFAKQPKDAFTAAPTIDGTQINGLRANLAALAIRALIVPVLAAFDGFDDDVCHEPRVSEFTMILSN